MARRVQFVAALVLDLLGAAVALLIATRTWQTVLTPRPRPLADDVLNVSGRTLDSAATALALVALAGVVAVLATRGFARRCVGAVLAAAGAGLVWRSLTGLTRISASRARALVESRHSGVGVDARVVAHITVHPQWAVLSGVCGVVVLAAGLLVATRGHTWVTMSAKYDAPSGRPGSTDGDAARMRADASLWTALDRGDDPTAHAQDH
jgi:uncharacterized membrane protein (TIGR02234 family)